MDSLPTLPRRSWLERALLSLAGALAVLGLLGAVGWWLGIGDLVQMVPGYAPIKINVALCFVVLGLALVGLEFGARRATLFALGVVAIASFTLLESAFHLKLPLDELLAPDHLLFDTEQPGRMAVMMATCLVLAGITIAWRAIDRAPRARLFAEAVIGSALGSSGLSTLLGYAAQLPTVYRWGTLTATSPAEAAGLIFLGSSLLLLAWRDSTREESGPPAWSPMPAAIACLTLTVILWIGLRARERDYIGTTTDNAMSQLAANIDAEFDKQLNFFERVARSWSASGDESDDVRHTQASTLMTDVRGSGCAAIAYLDADAHTVWTYPDEGHEGEKGFNNATEEARRSAIEAARVTKAPAVSGTTRFLISGKISYEKGIIVYAPILRRDSNTVSGFVAAEFSYKGFFGAVASASSSNLDTTYRIVITPVNEQEPVYESSASDTARNEDITRERNYVLRDRRRIHLSLTPTGEAVRQDRLRLPEVALIAGFGITILLGLTVHLARSARAGQHAAELSNKKLFTENEERRRVEARLKVSDERLRLALDSTQIGIFEWSVAAGHVYYSPGLWAMLGYEHARMPSTVEAWQSLIHPDDLSLYRRRTESQLNGIATFIEPEYRVRARSGDWRWVYTRSKSVSTGPDGRPTRIIGTVQDITARREAEIALRESQAEARKLSLVASKTDNPVLIGSPDGRIEWANEAFCRVMEYSLDDVIGKNPAHFMIGPETSSRTIARIRAAMARGQGISTDVVNYSKSGRKYHLHLEVQPVRGASGEIENFIAVETDITVRVETENQLRRAKAEADEASRAKSEFLASMSHEIRTPMNGVIGMTSLLMETSLSAEQRDFVNTIRTSGEALLTIINDILDFSKIESGKMELERMPFELSLCVEEALDLFALQCSSKKLELTYHIASEVPAWIVGDITRLRQVIVNLVNNAVKFTPSGSISLEVRRAHREPAPLGFEPGLPEDPSRVILEFTVHDTGIGIPADRVDRLFKAFSQVDSSTTRKYGGTGLGLAICQRLAHLMGGAIRVESEVGQGSSFIFTIQTEPAPLDSDPGFPMIPAALRNGTVIGIEDHPVTQARLRTLFEKWGAHIIVVPDATAALEAVRHLDRPPALLVVDGGEIDGPAPLDALTSVVCPRLVIFPFGQTAPATPGDGQPFASTSKPLRTSGVLQAIVTLFNPAAAAAVKAKATERPLAEEFPLEVLLAEDNTVNQKVALRFLERLGYQAVAVANGLEAVTAAQTRHFDLVLMDLQMPEMDGLEASRRIRAEVPADRQPKIIALTANAMQGDRELCLAAGMDDYVSKPVKIHEISAAIRRQFGKRAPASPRVIG